MSGDKLAKGEGTPDAQRSRMVPSPAAKYPAYRGLRRYMIKITRLSQPQRRKEAVTPLSAAMFAILVEVFSTEAWRLAALVVMSASRPRAMWISVCIWSTMSAWDSACLVWVACIASAFLFRLVST